MKKILLGLTLILSTTVSAASFEHCHTRMATVVVIGDTSAQVKTEYSNRKCEILLKEKDAITSIKCEGFNNLYNSYYSINYYPTTKVYTLSRALFMADSLMSVHEQDCK